MTTSKARAEAAPRNDYDFHKVRYRNWLSVVNPDSGVWLTAGASPKIFEMSNDEFVSAVCRRNTVEDPIVPKYKPWMSREDHRLFQLVDRSIVLVLAIYISRWSMLDVVL